MDSIKLLLIDDDVSLYKLIKISFKNKGYEVLYASDWRNGLRIAYEQHPDIVILDIVMPEMDG